METRDLAYFETIAELGHVGKAAKKLFLTQPALTRAVRRLEETLGTPLFERQGRGIKLTPMGEVLLEKARSLRHILINTERELLDFAHGRSGHIRLGCAPTVGSWLLSEALGRMRQEAPGVTLGLTFDMGRNLLEMLYTRQLDLVLSYIGGPLQEGYAAIPLINDVVVVAASECHPLFSRPYSVKDLADYCWILPNFSMFTRNWLEKTMRELELPPPKMYLETNTMLYIFDLTATSQSLCFLSRRNLSFFGGGVSLRELELPELTLNRVFSLAFRTDGHPAPAVEKFCRILREWAATVPGPSPMRREK